MQPLSLTRIFFSLTPFPPIKAAMASGQTSNSQPNPEPNQEDAEPRSVCTGRRSRARHHSGDHGRGPHGLLRAAEARRRPARHPGGSHRRPPQPGAPGLLPLLQLQGGGASAAAAAAVRRDRRPGRLQVPQGDLHPRPHRPRPLPPRPRPAAVPSGPGRRSSASRAAAFGRRAGGQGSRASDRGRAGVGGAAAAEPDAGLHQAQLHRVGRDVRDVHVLLLVGDRRRGQRVQGPQPGVRRQAAAVGAQEEAVRRRALGGQHHRQPVPLLQEKKEPGEDDDPSAGGEREDRGHPGGRVLVEEVRAEAHQGIPLPTGLLQVQHSEGVPGSEARGAGAGRPGDAGGDLRGRAPPLAGAHAHADADADGRRQRARLTLE